MNTDGIHFTKTLRWEISNVTKPTRCLKSLSTPPTVPRTVLLCCCLAVVDTLTLPLEKHRESWKLAEYYVTGLTWVGMLNTLTFNWIFKYPPVFALIYHLNLISVQMLFYVPYQWHVFSTLAEDSKPNAYSSLIFFKVISGWLFGRWHVKAVSMSFLVVCGRLLTLPTSPTVLAAVL